MRRVRSTPWLDPAALFPEQWQRNQVALAVAVGVWFAGTSFVLPFLTLYVQELGSYGAKEAAFWSGISLAMAPLVSAVVSPLWGALADRLGRKLLLERSVIGFTLSLGLMALATSPWQILALRLVMGLFGGFVSTALAIVTLSNPPQRVSEGIGAIQSARVLGMAAGPLAGGVLADRIGIRNSLLASVVLGVLALVLIAVLVREPPAPGRSDASTPIWRFPWRIALTSRLFFAVFCALLVIRFTERTFDPVLPLLLGSVGVPTLGIATTTGLIVTAGMVATSISAAVVGARAGRWLARRRLLLSLFGCAAGFAPLPLAQTWWQLTLLRVVVGALLGATVTLAFLVGTEITRAEHRAFSMGVLGSGQSYGSALGYFAAGLLSVIDIRAVFLVDSALFLGVFALGVGASPRGPAGLAEGRGGGTKQAPDPGAAASSEGR